jgi:hypothetical protein
MCVVQRTRRFAWPMSLAIATTFPFYLHIKLWRNFAMLLEITAGDFAFARGSSSYRHQSRSRHLEFRGDSQ